MSGQNLLIICGLLTVVMCVSPSTARAQLPSQPANRQAGVGGQLPEQASAKASNPLPRFYHQYQLGFAFGNGEIHPSVGVIGGHRFGDRVALGLGLNYDRYQSTSALPLYLQPRFYLREKKNSLYAFSDVGWSFVWQNRDAEAENLSIDTKNGLMAQLGTAWQFQFEKAALNFSVGYKLQKTKTHYEYWYWVLDPEDSQQQIKEKYMDIRENRMYKRLVFTMGLVF